MINAIKLFNQWVDSGKDNGMILNHAPSVEFMLKLIPDKILENDFSFMDLGCGNGWVVKQVSEYEKCIYALGLDGAEKMIKKARSIDTQSQYLEIDINNLDLLQSNNNSLIRNFDIIFSMEVLYYLESPKKTLQHIYSQILKKGGCCIIGIDHYLENTASLSWKKDLNVYMVTHSIQEWKDLFIQAGFQQVKTYQCGQNKGWEGTLVFYAEK